MASAFSGPALPVSPATASRRQPLLKLFVRRGTETRFVPVEALEGTDTDQLSRKSATQFGVVDCEEFKALKVAEFGRDRAGQLVVVQRQPPEAPKVTQYGRDRAGQGILGQSRARRARVEPPGSPDDRRPDHDDMAAARKDRRAADLDRARAVSRSDARDLELEARRCLEGPAPDRRRLPLVHRQELPPGQSGGPRRRGAAEGERQRCEAPSRATPRRGRGRAPGDPPDDGRAPSGGAVRRTDRADCRSAGRGARRSLGGDRHARGDMDNPRVEDEGGPRVRRAVEYGRAGRARAGGQAVRRVVARLPVEDRRAVAEEGARASAAPCGCRLDAARVPFERAVVDGGIRRPGGGRGGLPRTRPEEPGRPGLSAVRLAGEARPSPPGSERIHRLAVASVPLPAVRGLS